jgi:acyl transferase domain-containing protein
VRVGSISYRIVTLTIGITTGPQAWRQSCRSLSPSKGRTPLFSNVQTGCGGSLCLVFNMCMAWTLSPEVRRPLREANMSRPLIRDIKMHGAVPPLPHVFILWCPITETTLHLTYINVTPHRATASWARASLVSKRHDYIRTPHSVGLLWTRDQPDAETSTWQQTTLTTGKLPWPRRYSNPQS